MPSSANKSMKQIKNSLDGKRQQPSSTDAKDVDEKIVPSR